MKDEKIKELKRKVKLSDYELSPSKLERRDRNGKSLLDKQKELKWSDERLLAEYDRVGGLIKKDGHTVKMGSFWNFKDKQPQKDIIIMLEFRAIDGRKVYIEDGKKMPLEVQAGEKLKK